MTASFIASISSCASPQLAPMSFALLFNAPIGYAKKPLISKRKTIVSTTVARSSPPPSTGSVTIDKLPLEITLQIASYLGQIDVLSLSCTNKAMLAPCLRRLYDTVVVDSDYTQFSKEYSPSATYVNLLYNFKKLIRTQMRERIRALHVVSLPDLTNIYDADVNESLHTFFSSLTNLHELVWLLDNFRLDYLRQLPNHPILTRLELNIKFSNYLGELSVAPAVDDATYSFPNLLTFHIKPFCNLKRLVKLLNNLLVAQNAQYVRGHLRSLKLARFDKDTTVLIPPARELNNPLTPDTSVDAPHEFELDTLESAFVWSNMGQLRALSELSLNNLLVCEKDAQLLINSVRIPQLTRLEFKNVSEYGDSGNDVRGVGGFLAHLAPLLNSLTHLHLDYRETTRDSVGSFLAGLPGENLRALDLVVRVNELKLAHVDLPTMYEEYGSAIMNQIELRKFSVEIREENSFCDILNSTPLELLTGLHALRNLESLRLNCGDSTQGVSALLDLLKSLRKLKILDVFGAKAGGAPNLGLGMIHPNVYDEWFKVQHVALLYWQAQNNLQYVRINKCIFEYTDEGIANPRDVIDRWFDSKVRVDWEQ